MAGFLEQFEDTVSLLIGKREEQFSFEKEIRLYQFQTWMLFPNDDKLIRVAGRLAGAHFLHLVERRLRKPMQRRPDMKELIKSKKYRSLYKGTIERFGGFDKLVRQMPASDFQAALKGGNKNAEDVWPIIDYRFRYLIHHGKDRRQANIVHGRFFWWKQLREKPSGRTLQRHWDLQKRSAIPLYVSQAIGPSIMLDPVSATKPAPLLRKMIANTNFELFFRRCKFVSDLLRCPSSTLPLPEFLASDQPPTAPLSDEEIGVMGSYSKQRHKLNSSE